jgi:hypothetical protein
MNAIVTADLATRTRRDASAERVFKGIFAGAGWLVLILLIGAAASMCGEDARRSLRSAGAS